MFEKLRFVGSFFFHDASFLGFGVRVRVWVMVRVRRDWSEFDRLSGWDLLRKNTEFPWNSRGFRKTGVFEGTSSGVP